MDTPIMISDHGANRKPSIEKQAGDSVSDRNPVGRLRGLPVSIRHLPPVLN